jgi:hypothetical protein
MSTIESWLGPQWTTIVAGLVLTLILWLVLATFTRKTTTIDSANPVSGFHLKNHLCTLESAFGTLPPNASSSLREEQYRTAHAQVEGYIKAICEEISIRDVRWLSARGYLKAWNLLHSAEEAMIALQPCDEVIREALHDELSLAGSGMPLEADALHKLRTAMLKLSPSATVYLSKAEHATSAISGSSTARDALRDVRRILNEYRDGLWEGLVSLRNQLVVTTFITGLFTYLLLLLATLRTCS